MLVIDGGSTDGTVDIATKAGAKIIVQPANALDASGIRDFSAVRNVALKESTQPWIFVLDSDEAASQELWQSACRVAESAKDPAAYLVARRYVRPDGVVIQRASTYPNERLYFFHRDAVEKWIKPVHERVLLKPGVNILRLASFTLAPLPTVEEFKRKNRRYLAIEVALSGDKSWRTWFTSRLLHTLRSRLIALVRLAGIWLVPGGGPRLPLRHELLRFWYAWRLIVETCPLTLRNRPRVL
jgi:glycosyltransferase involved in cell wall biosynthesis